MKTFTLSPSKAFENGRTPVLVSPGGGASYYNIGNGARWKWTTSARKITVDGYATGNTGNLSPASRIGLLVDHVPYFYQQPKTEPAYFAIGPMWLPVGANKVVELLVTQQNSYALGTAPLGAYPISVTFDAESTEISPSLQANHLVIYGDSITSGGVAICPSIYGFAGLMKNGAYAGSVTQVSHGYRCLHDDCSSPAAAATFAQFIKTLSPTRFLAFIGSNDQAINVTLASAHQAEFGYLLDALHAEMPTLPIHVLSPVRRGTEGANGNGETMAQFRTAQSTVVTARSGWSPPPTYDSGLPIFADLTYLPDQVHPDTAGNVILKDYILANVLP